MNPVVTAYTRSLRSLARPAIVWHLIWPTLLAIALWGAVAWVTWDDAGAAVLRAFEEVAWLRWIAESWENSPLAAAFFVHALLLLLLLPLIYGTALLIVAAFTLPLMLNRVAAWDYPDVERRHGGSFAGSMWNALVAVAVFVLAWLVTLPLWLIPGVAIVLPVLLSAYVNQRAYRYDALAEHADEDELRGLIESQKGQLYMVGIVGGMLSYVPVLNLIVPAYTALAFIHFSLEALRRYRTAKRTPALIEGETWRT